jgi:hypothetical protein
VLVDIDMRGSRMTTESRHCLDITEKDDDIARPSEEAQFAYLDREVLRSAEEVRISTE